MSDLQKIPGVGPNIAADLEAIGIHSVDDLRGKDPEALYARLLRGEGPSWLQPVLLPPQLAETFYLYQVCYEAADTAGASK